MRRKDENCNQHRGQWLDGPGHRLIIPLVERTAKRFEVREVSAYKAYLSRKNLSAVVP